MELKQYEKYVTVTEGMDYRTISKELLKLGINLKHATVRNITEKTMPIFLDAFIENAGFDKNKINKETVLRTVSFYDNLIEIINKVISRNPELIKETIKEIENKK
jgi:hypothetical protein